MAELFDWSPVADNNNDAPPNGFPEGMAPSAVNNAAREVMAVMARAYQAFGSFPQVNGSANALNLTLQQAITGADLVAGRAFGFRAASTNTGACTLNVDATGANALLNTRAEALTAGQILAGSPYIAVHDGTAYRLINIAFTIGTTAGDLVALDASGFLPQLDGRNLRSLNATQLTSGTIPEARFASNSNGNGIRTISNAAPTGGAVGDIHYQRV